MNVASAEGLRNQTRYASDVRITISSTPMQVHVILFQSFILREVDTIRITLNGGEKKKERRRIVFEEYLFVCARQRQRLAVQSRAKQFCFTKSICTRYQS